MSVSRQDSILSDDGSPTGGGDFSHVKPKLVQIQKEGVIQVTFVIAVMLEVLEFRIV